MSPDLKRVVVVGHVGTVTLDALKWMQDTGTTFVQIGHDGELMSTGLPERRPHGEVLRAQALAQVTGTALAISKVLVRTKIEGQLAVLDQIAGPGDAASHLRAYALDKPMGLCYA